MFVGPIISMSMKARGFSVMASQQNQWGANNTVMVVDITETESGGSISKFYRNSHGHGSYEPGMYACMDPRK